MLVSVGIVVNLHPQVEYIVDRLPGPRLTLLDGRAEKKSPRPPGTSLEWTRQAGETPIWLL